MHVVFAAVTQPRPTLWDPMDCSMPGFPVLQKFLEPAQTHVHWVDDATQSSHPLSSPSPPAFNVFQHQGFFQWVGSFQQVAKVLELQIQHQSFQWYSGLISFRTGWLGLLAVQGTLSKSLLSTTVQKYQLSVLSLLYGPTLTTYMTNKRNHSLDYIDLCQQSNVSAF